jgi:RHS repeat-associated protein
MIKKLISTVLIAAHIFTYCLGREAFAFSAQSASYKLSAGAATQGGKDRLTTNSKVWQDSLGESCVGKAQSANYVLNSGFIPTLSSNPPVLTQKIPFQKWQMGASKENSFDLDVYFQSPEGYALTYSVSGNSNVNVTINPVTHVVSFSQNANWYGVEKVYFTATDTENSFVKSNKVVLQVINPLEPNKPVIVDTQITPAVIQGGNLVTLIVTACDPENSDLVFTYSDFFTETRKWRGEGGYWFSEAKWQTSSSTSGHYTVNVTVKDATNLTDVDSVLVNVGNFNRAPVLNALADITVNEGDLAVVVPQATDADNDAITYYYSAPLDSQGKWLTTYDDSGTRTATVTASDGIDTVSRPVKIIVNNVNRAPQPSLTLSAYTVSPNSEFTVYLSATDLDGDAMTFSIKKDDQVIASGNLAGIYTITTSISAIGDHTITATVTDALSKSTTVLKGVDVADPSVNQYAINPVMGDFNGDSLSDLGIHNSDTGTWEICLSDKGVFRNAVDWLIGFGTTRDWWPQGGDFNGDGKTDVGIYNVSNGQLQIAVSSGSGFTSSGTWLTFSEASSNWQSLTGNFNADKYTDFALYNKTTGEVRVALGTGTGFGAMTTWATSAGTDYVALGGDFNGDGLTDLGLFKKSSGEFKVVFSDSKKFVDGSIWITGYATEKDVILSDFNNDGLCDIGYFDKTAGKWYYAVAKGMSFVDKGLFLDNFGASTDDSGTTADFNGDGIIDEATFARANIGINRWTTRLSTNKPADLLIEIDNGIGGKTQVTYSYAALSDNADLPFPVYVASSVDLINTFPADRAATYTQNFTFSGGYFDFADREFRGFAKVKATDPITNNYTETYFYQGKPGQDGALKGQIDKVIAFDGNGLQISKTQNTYEVRKAGPSVNFLGFPMLKAVETTVWEENATSIATKDNFTYDNIGNVVEGMSEGDVLKTGDEKLTATVYAQAYENGFNRPLEAMLKDKDGNIVSKKDFEYDAKGNLSKEVVLIFNGLTGQQASGQTQYSYDSFGNLTSSTDALGHTVTTDYETTFYAYPQRVANVLGQSVTYVYDSKLGIVISTTDPNGNTSSSTYDSFGRPLQIKNALDQIVTTYSYPDFNTKITTNAIGLMQTDYMDGLGRKYKSVSSGEDGAQARQISSEVYFNSRGLKDSESIAHYIDESSGNLAYVRYEYDIRGRVKKTISDFPGTEKDAQSSINYINPLYAETIDPQGHRKGVLKDVYGNVIDVTEFTQGGVYHTLYEYDFQNNLVKTTDAQNNVTQIFYDSIGRKLKMIDPDMGIWTYGYDLLGNLIKQTDAKNQILEFQYDSLNRLTNKLANGSTIVTYIYDDTSKDYCIGRLSKITDQSGLTEFFYDKLGREIKSIKTVDSVAYTVERTYDILDRLATLKYPDGALVNYSYDANSGLLEKVYTGSAAPYQYYVKDIIYSAKGQIKTIQYGNNVTTNYTYGQDLRLSRICTNNGQGANLQDLNYIFDKNGNITTLTDNLRSNIRTYNYDDFDRLIHAENIPSFSGGHTNFDYQYDPIGNMIYKSDVGVMSYGAGAGPHALTSTAGYTYQYDSNGNMITNRNRTLSYDIENRLMQVSDSGIITSFLYDGDGGRVKQTLTSTSASTSTTYIGSLFEKDSSGKLTKHIFAGSNKVCSISSNGPAVTTNYFHSDHLGSSSVVTNADGIQVSRYEYSPYGSLTVNELADGQTSQPTNYYFTGKELDSTGLYFYGARYYDPVIGRFITADTIVQAPFDPQSLNRYAYCRNNPLKYVDPSGHFFWMAAIIGAIVGAISGGISAAQAGGSIWGGILFGAAFGAATGVIGYGTGQAMLAAAEAAGQAITSFGGALITGVEFGIGGIGPGMASGFAGGKGSFLDVLKGGAMGFGTGFVTGAAVGYSYSEGWQSFLHGADIRGTNAQIFMDQIANGNYAGATQTIAIDRPLRLELMNLKGEATQALENSRAGIYLRGQNAKGAAYTRLTRQLDGERWVTKPYAIDKMTGKMAIQLNPSEYRAFVGTPGFGRGEYFALAVAPDEAVKFEGYTAGGAPQWIMHGEHEVLPGSPFKNPN